MNYSKSSKGFVHNKLAVLVKLAIKGLSVTALTLPVILSAYAEDSKSVDKGIGQKQPLNLVKNLASEAISFFKDQLIVIQNYSRCSRCV